MSWENVIKTKDAGFTGFNRPEDIEEPNEERKYSLRDAEMAERMGVSLDFKEKTEEMFKGAMQRVGEQKMTLAKAKKLRALYDAWDELGDEEIKSLVGVLQLGWSWPNNIYLPFKSEGDAELEQEKSQKRIRQRIEATVKEVENGDLPEEDKNKIIEALRRRYE